MILKIKIYKNNKIVKVRIIVMNVLKIIIALGVVLIKNVLIKV
jgi:hypothetical protein